VYVKDAARAAGSTQGEAMARPKQLITPKELPVSTRRSRSSEYVLALAQFVDAGCDSAVVNIPKKTGTVASALAKAIKADKRFAGVKVARRGDEVYLVKK
jgi:hypothetical protein